MHTTFRICIVGGYLIPHSCPDPRLPSPGLGISGQTSTVLCLAHCLHHPLHAAQGNGNTSAMFLWMKSSLLVTTSLVGLPCIVSSSLQCCTKIHGFWNTTKYAETHIQLNSYEYMHCFWGVGVHDVYLLLLAEKKQENMFSQLELPTQSPEDSEVEGRSSALLPSSFWPPCQSTWLGPWCVGWGAGHF